MLLDVSLGEWNDSWKVEARAIDMRIFLGDSN